MTKDLALFFFARKQSTHLSIKKDLRSFTVTSVWFGIIMYDQHQ